MPKRPAPDRPLRLLVLASKPRGQSPSQRFRLEQWEPHLRREHDISLDLAPFESEELASIINREGHGATKAYLVMRDFMRRGSIVERARSYDGVVIHREAALIGPAIYERMIAATGKPIIFDFDDAIWRHQPGSSLASRLHFAGKTRSIARIAAAVTCGNSYLAEFARLYNANTFIVPTSIELSDYPLIDEPPSERFIVCWTGTTSTLRHLAYGRDALNRLARDVPLTVKIICSEPPSWKVEGAENLFVRWTAENEARDLGECHAAIMPLPDDDFTRGKCGAKALQAMAAGRPVVISPVGMNLSLVQTGRNGFLAGSTEEFVAHLGELAASSDLRRRIGAAGRRTVEEHYSATASATKFAQAVRSVIG